MRGFYYDFMHTLLTILSVLLIGLIMIQGKGSGLSIIPNSNDFGKFERRGPEKILHQATMILAILFVVVSAFIYFMA